MAKLFLNQDMYVGSTGHNLKNMHDQVFDIAHKMDYGGYKNISIAPMCYNTLGENPNLNLINKPGIYPLYSYSAHLTNGSTKFIHWGCCIVLPYVYGINDGTEGDNWYIQILICANGWDQGTTDTGVTILTRRCSYYNGWGKWSVCH